MEPGILKIDEKELRPERVLQYFRDNSNVVQVSKSGLIDFEIVVKYLNNLKEKPNLYGILTKNLLDEKWRLRYIGQRKSPNIRQRLREHLVRKDSRTGSKLEKINCELIEGNEIGLKLIAIIPDELRLYYEAMLLRTLNELDWNIHK